MPDRRQGVDDELFGATLVPYNVMYIAEDAISVPAVQFRESATIGGGDGDEQGAIGRVVGGGPLQTLYVHGARLPGCSRGIARSHGGLAQGRALFSKGRSRGR